MGKFNLLTLAVFFIGCLTFSSASYELETSLVELVRAQIQLEMKASLFYQTYGHYFENSELALHGFAKYFYEESLEEKKHADKLMTYLNQRGASIKTLSSVSDICLELTEKDLCNVIANGKDPSQLTKPIDDVPLTAIQNAVELEKKVYNKLEAIAKGSDSQLSHFIEHEYLDGQVESIKELKDFQTHLKKLNKNYVGLLMVDKFLLEKAQS